MDQQTASNIIHQIESAEFASNFRMRPISIEVSINNMHRTDSFAENVPHPPAPLAAAAPPPARLASSPTHSHPRPAEPLLPAHAPRARASLAPSAARLAPTRSPPVRTPPARPPTSCCASQRGVSR